MVCHRPGDGGRALDDIQPVHIGLPIPHPPLRSKIACVTQTPRDVEKEVRIKGKDNVGSVEAIPCVDRFAIGEAGTGASIIMVNRLVLMPFGGWELGQQFPQLVRKRRRSNGFGQNPQPRAFAETLRRQLRAEGREKGIPYADASRVADDLRALRVIKR